MDAVRSVTRVPLHVRTETVHGRDFGDARAAEKVTATLKRSAIECVADSEDSAHILQAVKGASRRSPVRWHQTAVLARGRFE